MTNASTQTRGMKKQQLSLASHGRGGAGNMARSSPRPTPAELETPTLKTAIVTTGRGGTGNMARNECPHQTRMWQDVVG
ncbi:hypothetical protein CDD82_5492 [Ophiocordyceps australis]|uniref:Uncharacterized protein n=1 Tax=Ophiocordyceps australis TaxID=1399860 RepID=A0A2C5Z214_9HYPO|nr:hypothetical protein CDD82_5492 [Ophiocordyceps australis]